MMFSRRRFGIRPDLPGNPLPHRDGAAAAVVDVHITLTTLERMPMPELPQQIIDIRKWAMEQVLQHKPELNGDCMLDERTTVEKAVVLETYVLGLGSSGKNDQSSPKGDDREAVTAVRPLHDALVMARLSGSHGDARRMVRAGMVEVGSILVRNEEFLVNPGDRLRVTTTVPAP